VPQPAETPAEPRPPARVVRVGHQARQRVFGALPPVAQAALAAAVAWYLAHHVLGHAQPFFAPIAAAISLSTSKIQRSRRIAQMVGGVLLGIVVGDGLRGVLGSSTVALGVIVLLTMIVALAVGAGFFGDGMMFPNQAAASAILVVTLNRHGTGSERALDAVVGGAMAFVIGVGLFPAEPLSLLRNAEQRVLEVLANRLGEVSAAFREGHFPDDSWTLEAGFAIHQQLNALARARATARVNVRVAPRRWRRRAVVDAENQRTAQLDLLANAVISLIRSVTVQRELPLPDPELQQQISLMAGALRWLAEAQRPWPDTVMRETETAARAALAHAEARGIDRDQVVAAILRAVARDLLAVIAPRS
jgi:uncharacterized membrane protein YgaE (UPF0421/DUF939 family)